MMPRLPIRAGRTRRALSRLARALYELQGYVLPDSDADYDFENSTHPQERLCWAMATTAYEHLRFAEAGEVIDEEEASE